MFSGSASCIGDFEFDTPFAYPVPGNPETIPGIRNSYRVGLGGIYSAPQDELLPEEVVTLIRCSVGDIGLDYMPFLANFRFPVAGDGNDGLSHRSVCFQRL